MGEKTRLRRSGLFSYGTGGRISIGLPLRRFVQRSDGVIEPQLSGDGNYSTGKKHRAEAGFERLLLPQDETLLLLFVRVFYCCHFNDIADNKHPFGKHGVHQALIALGFVSCFKVACF